jgi:hypothetical protein
MEMIIFLALSNGFRASLRPNSSSKNPRPKKSRALKQKTHSAGEWVESFCFEIRLQKRPPPPGWIPGKSIPAKPVGESRVHEAHSVARPFLGFNYFFPAWLQSIPRHFRGAHFNKTAARFDNPRSRQHCWLHMRPQ